MSILKRWWSATSSWLGARRADWVEWRKDRAVMRQLRRERKAEMREELHLARMWASSNLVAEVRRHNDQMERIVTLLQTWLAPTSRDAGGDNSPVEIDEVAEVEDLTQEQADLILDKLRKGESLTDAEARAIGADEAGEQEGVDRVEDGG